MKQLQFDKTRPLDMILLGRIAIDFNPVDYFQTLSQSTTFKKYVGGSPANIAVGLARLQKKTGFFAKVSADRFGDYVTEYFQNEGIDTSHITRCMGGESLGLTFTEILSPESSNILMYRNGIADLALCPEDIEENYIKSAKCLLISGTALAASPSREAALKAVMLANKTNTPIVFDIDYRAYNWKNPDEISIYYAMVAHESSILMGSREEYDLMEQLIEPGRSDEETAGYWLGKGNRVVIIKHGKQGSAAYVGEGERYFVKPFPVKALKGFGGGDGYASSFLYGILEGWEIPDCLELGSASASMLVASHACSQDMPTLEKIRDFIKKGKLEYGEVITKG